MRCCGTDFSWDDMRRDGSALTGVDRAYVPGRDGRTGMGWAGLVWAILVWSGMGWPGVGWHGLVLPSVVWPGPVWSGLT